MTPEMILPAVIAVNLFFALTTDHIVWRVLGFKLAFDFLAILLMSFAGADHDGFMRTLGLLTIFMSSTLLFIVFIIAHRSFRLRKNEKN